MRAGTIVASNYVAMAQVLAESFLANHPESSFAVLIVDDGPADLPDSINVVRLDDLDLEPDVVDVMRTIYDVMEFATAVKPAFLAHLLDAGQQDDGDVVACYLDPDIVVYQPFDDLVSPAIDRGIVLTPHVLTPVPRVGPVVSEITIMQAGMYNCGFIAVSERARNFLRWWDLRLRFDAVVDVEHGLFTDQRWVDWVPSLFDFHISREPGMNVAWWNIHERPVDVVGEVPTVNGRPIRFVHFSGYDPTHPDRLSNHPDRSRQVKLEAGSGIRMLADDYAHRLRVCGHEQRRQQPYQWNVAYDGTLLTSDIRRRVRTALMADTDWSGEGRTVPDAFGFGAETFGKWLGETGKPRIERIAGFDEATPDAEPVDRATYDVEFEPGGVHERIVGLLDERSERGLVVDLGCGFAPHAEPLAAAGFGFVGVDANPESVAALCGRGVDARHLNLASEGSLESLLTNLESDVPVVAVLLLDVLEHLVDPHLFLARLRSALEQHPQAVVATSVPNVAHVDVAAKLVGGHWDVTPTGLLDQTHLRFFTSATLTAMMESAEFVEIARRDRLLIHSDQHWPERSPFVARDTPLARFLSTVSARSDDHGHTYQFVRLYERGDREDCQPTLVVPRRNRSSNTLTVVLVGASDERVTEVRSQLIEQSASGWELLATASLIQGLDDLVSRATGEYLTFLDLDDVITGEWVATIERAGCDAYGEPLGAVLWVQPMKTEGGGSTGPTDVGAAGSYAFPVDALRDLRPTWDGDVRSGVTSLLLQMVPFCGLAEVRGDTVRGHRISGSENSLSLVAEIATRSLGEPVLSSFAERQAHAEARRENEFLRRRLTEIEGETERLRGDVRWLNAELSTLPVRALRRLGRRPGSVSDSD